jgi:hypothetical protein
MIFDDQKENKHCRGHGVWLVKQSILGITHSIETKWHG